MSGSAPLQLPRLGNTCKGDPAGPSNGTSGSDGGVLHDSVFGSPLSDRSSHAIRHLCSDGPDGPRLVMGIRSLFNWLMPNRNGHSRVVSDAQRVNSRVNFQLVPALSNFPAGSRVAPGRSSVRGLDRARNVDVLPHKAITLMPFSLLIKLIPLAGFSGGVIVFAEGGDTLGIIKGVLGSASFIGVISVIRYLIERADKQRAERIATGRTDAQYDLEREKLVDTQTLNLLKEWKDFYDFKDKEKQTIIQLQQATLQQKDSVINDQRDLIVSQTAALEALRKKSG